MVTTDGIARHAIGEGVADHVKFLREILRCPVCKGELAIGDGVECRACGRRFTRRQFCLDLIPYDDLKGAQWETWEQLQRNGQAVYERDPENNLAVGERWDAVAFRRFCHLSGRVLDVGCGIQEHPSYVDPRAIDGFVGVDPLGGAGSRAYPFVQALGEFLPFANGSFDSCLFATSLDHLVLPKKGLAQAAEVLRDGGLLHIWHGCLYPPAGRAIRFKRHATLLITTYWRRVRELASLGEYGEILTRSLQRLHVLRRPTSVAASPSPPEPEPPAGAEDSFHLRHFSEAELVQWARELDLRVVERRAIPSSFVSYHLFLTLKKKRR